ncbi:cytochrome b [Marinimicrobium sp. ABcell2]|uniref:cytochrome b n=1 Tax=Marinimicrobium sp. ABcell2 TaxID=3069751 RepID=UPI0027B5FEED|nr:cytochrome b [Marinimicrobium sp. ABcell2]MDQ2076914.1 cytochrome b [Marinimicrobium sp. ABcell2]
MLDNPQRYGQVSRILHWGMALILFWQFFTVGFRVLMEDSAIDNFMWSTHRPLGAILLLLVAIRIVWALFNRTRRPAAVSTAAKLGHIALYGMLVLIPALGLLRHYGAGRPFDVFGIPLFSGFEGRIEWLVYPGNLLHSSLGWTLMAMVLGHMAMVVWHRKRAGQVDVLPRMWGRN